MPKPNTGGLEMGNLYVLYSIKMPTSSATIDLSNKISRTDTNYDNIRYLMLGKYSEFGVDEQDSSFLENDKEPSKVSMQQCAQS